MIDLSLLTKWKFNRKVLEQFPTPDGKEIVVLYIMHPDQSHILYLCINKKENYVHLFEDLRGLLMYELWGDKEEDYSRDVFTVEQYNDCNGVEFLRWIEDTYYPD